MDKEVIYYQITDKDSTGAFPVSLKKIISTFGIGFEKGDVSDKIEETICFDTDCRFFNEEFLYFKKVKIFRKSISKTFKIDNCEFGIWYTLKD